MIQMRLYLLEFIHTEDITIEEVILITQFSSPGPCLTRSH